MINGTAAAVQGVTETELVVTVGAGTTTGTIAVTAPGGSATSTAPYIVGGIGGGLPTVTGVSPAVVGAGATVTITGANFDPTAVNNVVALGGPTRATVNTATATSLNVTVPPYAGSGHVEVVTENGAVTSAADLFIAPQGVPASSITATGRLATIDTKTVNLNAVGNKALLVFDSTVASDVSVSVSGPAAGATVVLSI